MYDIDKFKREQIRRALTWWPNTQTLTNDRFYSAPAQHRIRSGSCENVELDFFIYQKADVLRTTGYERCWTYVCSFQSVTDLNCLLIIFSNWSTANILIDWG